jgi:hypothetical protein
VIDPDTESVFPNNVVECLAIVLPAVDPDVVLLRRPLRGTDPPYSIGVYATLWTPDQESYEINPKMAPEPTLQEYQIGIQTLIKDGDPIRALRTASVLNKRVRGVLYRNAPLRVALGSLQVTDGTYVESFRRSGIRTQRYMSNDLEGAFVFISVIDFWIETETR